MGLNSSKNTIKKIFSLAGIKINGNNPWDIKVHNENFYKKVLAGGSLALGESYMNKWWDCKELDEFFYHILKARIEKKIKQNSKLFLTILSANFFYF